VFQISISLLRRSRYIRGARSPDSTPLASGTDRTTDSKLELEQGALMPLDGTDLGPKGYALSLMVEENN
jgi:LDH2 family malate/lactate/ureidoglycolate dehydrogenase